MESVVVLTGAGVSVESGIPLFRGDDGLWENHRIEDVATPEGFGRNPELVYEFYNARRRKLLSVGVQPNPGHAALARLERDFDGEVLIVTQNIDDLHERAGCRRVIHMHGELLKGRCAACGELHECIDDMDAQSSCPHCREIGKVRPHVVWFGEVPLEMDAIMVALSRCTRFVSVGTSGKVYPAAGFVEMARMADAYCIECNTEDTETSPVFQEHLKGPASQTLPALVENLCSG